MKILKFIKQNTKVASELINKGEVIATATDTVYGFSCDPFCENAVDYILKLKNRPSNMPFILLISQLALNELKNEKRSLILEMITGKLEKNIIDILLNNCPNPISFILPLKNDKLKKSLKTTYDTIAIRFPKNEVLQKLLCEVSNHYLVSTSANLSGEKTPTIAKEVIEKFDGKISLLLDGGKSQTTSSTIVNLCTKPFQVLRQGEYVFLPK